MYKFRIHGIINPHEYHELIKLFLRTEDYILLEQENESVPDGEFWFHGDKNRLKRDLFLWLSQSTGFTPPWGIMTGIRPIKLTGEWMKRCGDPKSTISRIMEEYLTTQDKAESAMEMMLYQHQAIGNPPERGVGIYIGIPFCPSRCAYCSFPSNQAIPKEMDRYLEALIREIQAIGIHMKRLNWHAETIYIGGGTPTSLTDTQLQRLFHAIQRNLVWDGLKEYSLEAGRPDTITKENMQLAYRFGVRRISINPQTMHDETLRRIGRNHTKMDIYGALESARAANIPVINMDLIAGLPGETAEEFIQTLDEILALAPENITVHSLAVKRTSRLQEADKYYHFNHAQLVSEMLKRCAIRLKSEAYTPYYLYRQKQMAGCLENIGYCLPGTEGIYNVRMMEENQTIIAMGAGGISKAYFPEENRHERIANVSNYEIYIERLEEMIVRKENELFRRFETC